MRLLLLVSLLAVVQSYSVSRPDSSECNGIQIDEAYYNKEVLKSNIDRPYLLAVDRSENVLYFSYSMNKDDIAFNSAYIDLKTKEFNVIEGIEDGFAQTVDDKTGDVYIGGSEGIFKYNHKSKEADIFGQKGNDIWYLYFKDVLYFSVFPSQKVFNLIDGHPILFKDLEDTKIDHMVIDGDGDIVFSNATGLFTQKLGTKDAIKYPLSQFVRGITTDKNGITYVCKYNGIFILNKESHRLKRVLELDDPFGVAFDADNNMIYSETHDLIRLLPNKDNNNC